MALPFLAGGTPNFWVCGGYAAHTPKNSTPFPFETGESKFYKNGFLSEELREMHTYNHHPIYIALILSIILVACAHGPAGTSSSSKATVPPGNPSGNGNCANAYFPTSVGTSWSYASSGSPLGAYTYTWTVTSLSSTGFSTSDQYSTGVNAEIKWECQNGNLAALTGGSNSLSLSTSMVKMTSSSITAEGYNIPADFGSAKSWSEKVTVDGTVTTSTAKSVSTQIVTQLDCNTAGTETVSVPAGTFDAVKVTCNENVSVSALMQGTPMPAGAPVTVNITNWYAKGVGLVQSVRVGGNPGTETVVLMHYKIQK